MSAEIEKSIADALAEGYKPQEILDILKNSPVEAHQNWYQNYSTNMQAREAEGQATVAAGQPNVSTLESFSELTPAQKLGVGAGLVAGSAGLGALGYYGKKQMDINAAIKEQQLKNELPLSAKDLEFQRQNDLAEKRLAIEERRLGVETAQPQLSPLEEIKLEREKLRLEAEKQRIARENELHQTRITQMARQAELNEQKAKAAMEAKTAVQKQQKAGGGLSPMDKTILNNQMTAAANSDVKAQVESKAPVAPPKAGPQIQLTPSPEVRAELPVVPLAGSAPKGESTVENAPTKAPKAPKAVQPPGTGGGDNWLHNTLGPEGYQEFITKYNEGKPIPNYEKAKSMFGSVYQGPKVREIPEGVRIERGIAPPEKAANFGKLGKIAAVAAAGATAAGSANAQEMARNLGEMLLPIGATPSEVQTGTLTEKQLRAYAEAQKLGSPYRSVPPPR
jgi:hypothetical protein